MVTPPRATPESNIYDSSSNGNESTADTCEGRGNDRTEQQRCTVADIKLLCARGQKAEALQMCQAALNDMATQVPVSARG